MQPHLNANTPPLCSLVLVRMARDHLFVFVDKLWLGSTEVYPPPLLFLALFTSLCDYIMTKGRGKMKRTNMLRRTRWNTHLGHRKRLFSNLTFPHTTCCLLHCFLEVRLHEGCLKDGKRRYRFVPTSERDEIETQTVPWTKEGFRFQTFYSTISCCAFLFKVDLVCSFQTQYL